MKASDVAKFFVDIFNKEQIYQITNLKLNKILFYAQGWFLNKYNKPLFNDQIEAWDLGPVVSDVYQMYKSFGKNHISLKDNEDDFKEDSISTEELELLIDVYNEYSKYSASELIDMTHEKNTPWDQVYEKKKNKVIPLELIKKYFASLDKIPSISDVDFSKLEPIGHIDTDGHLILPASERN